MNNCSTNHLYIMSFVAGADSGLAFMSAKSPDEAMSLLRNTGRYNGTPDTYKAIQIRDIGMATTIRSELLLESYVNALVAFDAIYNAVKIYTGPQGIPGKSAYDVARDNGYLGTEQEWLADLKGEKGDQGNPAGFGDVSARLPNPMSVGTPSVDVTVSGPNDAINMEFVFRNLRGDVGPVGPEGPPVPVVDNLVDGGTKLALSAEQGKVINSKFGEVNARLSGVAYVGDTLETINEWEPDDSNSSS